MPMDIYSKPGTKVRFIGIYSKPGTKVRFIGKNGYEMPLNLALKTFLVGQELTVKQIVVGSFLSEVQFEELPNKWFNTVMFEEVKPIKQPRAYRPQYKEYETVGYIIRYEKSIYEMTEAEFIAACMLHSHGAMNPNRAASIHRQLLKEAGL